MPEKYRKKELKSISKCLKNITKKELQILAVCKYQFEVE